MSLHSFRQTLQMISLHQFIQLLLLEQKQKLPPGVVMDVLIKWIYLNNFNVYDGRSYEHQTQKVKVKRNIYTKKTTLTLAS